MSKKRGVPGYPASQVQVYDVVYIDGVDFQVDVIYLGHAIFKDTTFGYNTMRPLIGNVRLIRKANGQTYATWQRKTSKLLKVVGLSKWPGAMMHEYFFNSVSPEEAAAGFMADHFEVDFIPIKFMEQ